MSEIQSILDSFGIEPPEGITTTLDTVSIAATIGYEPTEGFGASDITNEPEDFEEPNTLFIEYIGINTDFGNGLDTPISTGSTHLYVYGESYFDNSVNINSDLYVSGVTSTSKLVVPSNLETTGSGILVTGTTETDELLVNNNAEIDELLVNNNAEIDELLVNGTTTTTNLIVTGTSQFGTLVASNTATFNSDVDINGQLRVNGEEIKGQVSVQESGTLVSAAITTLNFDYGFAVTVNSGIASIISTGIGTTAPPLASSGGSNSQVQYNNSGVIGGASELVYDDLNNRVGLGGVSTPTEKLSMNGQFNFPGQAIKIGGNSNTNLGNDVSIYIGYQAGKSATSTNSFHTFIGHQAGRVSTGKYNSYFGYQSAYNNASGEYNLHSGYQSGYQDTSGSANVFLGSLCAYNASGGNRNVFIGSSTGYSNGGDESVVIGMEASYFGSSDKSVHIGYQASYNDNSNESVIIGYKSGYNNGANGVVLIGKETGYFNQGLGNVFVGSGAGRTNTSNSNNTFIGENSGFGNGKDFPLLAYGNSFLGHQSGYSNKSGYENTFIGKDSGYQNNFGNKNVFIGEKSGYNSEGSDNSFVGQESGYNNEGYDNSFFGRRTGYQNSSGIENTFLGRNSGYQNSSGSYNTFAGKDSGYVNGSKEYNTYIGWWAGSGKYFIEGVGTGSTDSGYGTFTFSGQTLSGTGIGIGTGSGTFLIYTSGKHTGIVNFSLTDTGSNTFSITGSSDYECPDGTVSFQITSNEDGTFNITGIGTHNHVGDNNVVIGTTDLIKSGNNQLVVGAGTSNWICGDDQYRVGLGTFKPNHKLDIEGGIEFRPSTSSTPSLKGDVTFEYVNNTTLKIKMRGTDGVVRSTNLILS